METERDSGVVDSGSLRPKGFFGAGAAILAVGIFLWQATDGWFEVAFGELALLFWAGIALWLVASALAVRARQHWWVITTAPFALYPLAAVALLIAACSQGNCL